MHEQYGVSPPAKTGGKEGRKTGQRMKNVKRWISRTTGAQSSRDLDQKKTVAAHRDEVVGKKSTGGGQKKEKKERAGRRKRLMRGVACKKNRQQIDKKWRDRSKWSAVNLDYREKKKKGGGKKEEIATRIREAISASNRKGGKVK